MAEVGGVVMDIEGVAHRAFLQLDGHAGVLRGDGCLACDCQVGRGDRVLLERAGAAYDVPIDPDAGGAEQASGLRDAERPAEVASMVIPRADRELLVDP